jgi:triosephosphate isomerase (TIM)
MNGQAGFGATLAGDIVAGLDGGVDVGVCPPYPLLPEVLARAAGSALSVGAQACHHEAAGAFTGAVSAPMLASFGLSFVLAGHSERRERFGATPDVVQASTVAALRAGLDVILCVGERLEDRESGRHEEVVRGQLGHALEALDDADLTHLTLAYEPVWAIGTGLTASPDQARDMHAVLRRLVLEQRGATRAGALRILYGGSVKPANARALLSQQGIDGALVGGASLKAPDFLDIIGAAVL